MSRTIDPNMPVEEGLRTILAPDIRFKGSLRFAHSLMVKGRLSGNIESDGLFVVAPRARVDATLSCVRLDNYGEVIGKVRVTGQVRMKNASIQTGDLDAGDLMIDSGCRINGSIRMTGAGSSGSATG